MRGERVGRLKQSLVLPCRRMEGAVAAQRRWAAWPRRDLRQLRGRGATEPRPFPSPSAQGPGCLMGIPVPPLGSREASDWLGL